MSTFKARLPATLILSLALLPSTQAAKRAPPPEPTPEAKAVAPEERNIDEDWYWGFNLGGGSMKYSDATTERDAESLKALPGMSHATLFFDLKFLWPMANRKTAIGVGLGGVNDTYEQGGVKLDVRTSLLTFSTLHFFSSNIGDGVFGQAEMGLATARQEATGPSVTVRSDTDHGTGIRLGLGYSFLLSNETRLPLTVLWQHANVKNNSGSNAVLFSAGLLF